MKRNQVATEMAAESKYEVEQERLEVAKCQLNQMMQTHIVRISRTLPQSVTD